MRMLVSRVLTVLTVLCATALAVVAGPPGAARAATTSRIMVVGDSISHGSSGDWTWRYRLWKHLQANGVTADFVGPRHDLFNIMTSQDGDTDLTYADAAFDQDHDAFWGRPLSDAATTIGPQTSTYQPDVLLVLLGINDLAWLKRTPAQVEADLRAFIANARAAKPGVKFVLGRLLPSQTAAADAAFAASVADYNQRLGTVAAQLTTTASPIAVAMTDAGFSAADHTWDGTHPNPRGELRIAGAFADVLAARYGIGVAYPRPYPDVPLGPTQAPRATITQTGASTADLSWTPSLGATQYWVWTQDTLYNTTWTKLPYPLTPDYNPWHVSQLGAGVTYRYKLQAAKGNNAGAFSNEVTLAPAGTAPAAPTGFTVTAGDNQAVLKWTEATGATGYLVSVRNVTDGETTFRQLPWPVTGNTWTAASLENGVRYEFKLQAVNGALKGGSTAAAGVTLTATAPGTPTLSVTNGNGQSTLNWTAVTGASGYAVLTRNVTAGETTFTRLPYPVADDSWVAGSLVNGATYEFKVQAMSGRVAGGTSNTVVARPTTTPPATPTGFTATAGNGTVTLRWNAVAGANGYYLLKRDVTGGETAFTRLPWPVAGTPWVAEDLVNGATYEFKVQSVSGLVDGGVSGAVTATPTVAAPAAPGGLTASADNGEATLRWTAAANATGYYVFKRNVTAGESGFTKLPYPVSGTDWTAEQLSNGGTYQFKLQSVSGLIIGATSAVVTVTPTGPAPAAPSLSGRSGNHKALLSWTMPANANAVYVYKRDVTAGETGFTKLPYPVADDSWTATGLTNGATYQFKVQTYNDLVAGGTSSTVTVVPDGPTAPGPENLSVTGGSSKAVLKWTASSQATGYYIWVKDTADWHRLPYPVADDSWTATGLVNGAPYQFKVQSLDGLSPGGYSNAVGVTPLGPTPQVSNLRVTPELGAARMQWTTSSTSTGYYVQYRDVSRGESTYHELPYPVAGSTFSPSLLFPGDVYDFRVRAISGLQQGVTSSAVRVTIRMPAAIRSLSADPADHSVYLTWKASPGADGYAIYTLAQNCSSNQPSRNTMHRMPYAVTGTRLHLQYLFNPTCWAIEVVAMKNGVEAPRESTDIVQTYTLRSNDDATQYNQVVSYIVQEMKINPTSTMGTLIDTLNHGITIPAATYYWYNQVRAGGPWDHKWQIADWPGAGAEGGSSAYRYHIPGNAYEMYYDIWSNIHYGYVGRALGFNRSVLIAAQHQVGVSDPGDDHSVTIGMDLWEQRGASISDALLKQTVQNNLVQYIHEGKATPWQSAWVANL